MELIFAYLAGLLTLINPCVLPVLPIVLGSALQASPRGPLALAAGMSVSFVILGVTVAAAGYALGLDAETVARAGAVVMIGFGLVLLVPALGTRFAAALAGVARGADARIGRPQAMAGPVDHGSPPTARVGTATATGGHPAPHQGRAASAVASRADGAGARGQFLGGLLLGAVWSPCIGPTLGGAIALASQGEGLLRAAAIMLAFAAGVSTLILGLGHGARALLLRHQPLMRRIARISGPLLGALFVLTGLAILLDLQHLAEAWAVRTLPAWLLDLSVSL